MSARRAVTLVEMLVALAVLAVISTTILGMLQAAASVNGTLVTAMGSEWELESALQRIVAQTRQCVSFSCPTGISGGESFSVVTPVDPANGNQSYDITYALVTLPDGTRQLQETDTISGTTNPRFETATFPLINNVQSFDVRYKSAASPTVLQISVTVGSKPAVTRVVKVTPRNQ